MIIRIQKNEQKARALITISKITLERLKETNIEKFPSNSLTDYYTIIRNLLEAITSLEGIKIKGDGAHIEIINYVCKEYELGESTRQFIQELRDYRNRTYYEGFIIKKEYIQRNKTKIEQIILKLMKLS